MKFYVLLLCLLFLSSCTTMGNRLDMAASELGFRKLDYWLAYSQDLQELEPRDLKVKRRRLEEVFPYSTWVSKFQLALILSLQGKSAQDLADASRIIKALSRDPGLDDEARSIIQWYELQVLVAKELAQSKEAYQLGAKDLQEKLDGLSKIEEKIQERSQRPVH